MREIPWRDQLVEPRPPRWSWREKQVLAALALHLTFPAWALGGMTMWAQWISIGTGLLAALTALRPAEFDDRREGGLAAVRRSPAVWAGAVVLLYVAIQGLNPAWRFIEGDDVWWMEAQAHVAWLPSGMDAPYALSNPWRNLVIFASAWLGVVAVVAAAPGRRGARVLLTVVVLNAAAVAVLGLIQQLTHAPGIYWSIEPPEGARWFGPFIYRNHAAAFLLPGLAAAFALAIFHHRRTRRRLARSGPGPLFTLLGIGIALGIVFSFSRAGAVLASMLVLGVGLWRAMLWWWRPPSRTSAWAGALVTVVLLVTAFVGFRSFDHGYLRERFSALPDSREEFNEERRVVAYQAAADMLRARWLTGWGAGGFRYLFPAFQQNYPTIFDTVHESREDGSTEEVKLDAPLHWEHAHSDLLEFPIELGLLGTLALLGGPAWWLWRGWRARLWRFAPGMILLAGLLLTVAHAGVDFVFQNPAVWITWNTLWPLLAWWIPPPTALLEARPDRSRALPTPAISSE